MECLPVTKIQEGAEWTARLHLNTLECGAHPPPLFLLNPTKVTYRDAVALKVSVGDVQIVNLSRLEAGTIVPKQQIG